MKKYGFKIVVILGCMLIGQELLAVRDAKSVVKELDETDQIKSLVILVEVENELKKFNRDIAIFQTMLQSIDLWFVKNVEEIKILKFKIFSLLNNNVKTMIGDIERSTLQLSTKESLGKNVLVLHNKLIELDKDIQKVEDDFREAIFDITKLLVNPFSVSSINFFVSPVSIDSQKMHEFLRPVIQIRISFDKQFNNVLQKYTIAAKEYESLRKNYEDAQSYWKQSLAKLKQWF